MVKVLKYADKMDYHNECHQDQSINRKERFKFCLNFFWELKNSIIMILMV